MKTILFAACMSIISVAASAPPQKNSASSFLGQDLASPRQRGFLLLGRFSTRRNEEVSQGVDSQTT
jgi:hypothetical protein